MAKLTDKEKWQCVIFAIIGMFVLAVVLEDSGVMSDATRSLRKARWTHEAAQERQQNALDTLEGIDRAKLEIENK